MYTDPRRVHVLNQADQTPGPVVYWMQRDQRVQDNWALLYAQDQALKSGQPLMVVFCLVPGFLGATVRHYGFMLKGLARVEAGLKSLNIPFFIVHGEPAGTLLKFLNENKAGMVVTDFNPLRIPMDWRLDLAGKIDIPFHEVDAHNIIPCRFISGKQEYAAFTLRKKVERLLPEFLTEFPSLVSGPDGIVMGNEKPLDVTALLAGIEADRSVPEIQWCNPGEHAASVAMEMFISHRLNEYANGRNFPDREGQSDLSPYLHFGQLSAQRLALEVKNSTADPVSKIAFLEELIVRRELADNFCLYNPDYDRFDGFQPWARLSLDKHRSDTRAFNYTAEEFEEGATHDPLWNAAQAEMVVTGKMHGFMRMYWAKKILEWSPSTEEAMDTAIYLNDKYELDGRDPNGYAGIAWSIGGTHDRPWGERNIFGMIRYMNYNGCKRKFDVEGYVRKIRNLKSEV